jgi:hypothetical protein
VQQIVLQWRDSAADFAVNGMMDCAIYSATICYFLNNMSTRVDNSMSSSIVSTKKLLWCSFSPTVGSNHNQTSKKYHFLHGQLAHAAITSTMPAATTPAQQAAAAPSQNNNNDKTTAASTSRHRCNKPQQQQRQDQTRHNNAANAAATIRHHNKPQQQKRQYDHHRHNNAAVTMTTA